MVKIVYTSSPFSWLGIHGFYINPPIMDEGAPIKKYPYKIEGHTIPI